MTLFISHFLTAFLPPVADVKAVQQTVTGRVLVTISVRPAILAIHTDGKTIPVLQSGTTIRIHMDLQEEHRRLFRHVVTMIDTPVETMATRLIDDHLLHTIPGQEAAAGTGNDRDLIRHVSITHVTDRRQVFSV